jgi:hypothetical protein
VTWRARLEFRVLAARRHAMCDRRTLVEHPLRLGAGVEPCNETEGSQRRVLLAARGGICPREVA